MNGGLTREAGKAEAMAEGKAAGLAEGQAAGLEQAAKAMLAEDIPIAIITKCTGIAEDKLREYGQDSRAL